MTKLAMHFQTSSLFTHQAIQSHFILSIFEKVETIEEFVNDLLKTHQQADDVR
jgi:hypothetical protein